MRLAAIALILCGVALAGHDVRPGRQAAPATRTLYILAIGISTYPNVAEPKPYLSYARPSARSFATRLGAAAVGAFDRVQTGDPGKHSPFAFRLLEGLRSATTKNGVVTYAHLMSYLERGKMEPRTGDFGDHEPGGDFLFIARQK